MKYKMFAVAVAVTLLAGCTDRRQAAEPAAPEKAPSQPAVTEKIPDREKQTTLAGGLAATLYVGDGYSIYIPDEGWTLELERGDDPLHQTWEADREKDAELTVYHYRNMSLMVARDRFLEECDYEFSGGMGGETGEPLLGKDDDGDFCEVMVAEGSHGTTYVIAWEYPEGTEETLGKTLSAAANTFELTE